MLRKLVTLPPAPGHPQGFSFSLLHLSTGRLVMTLSEILKENAGSVYRIIEGLIRPLSMNKGHLAYPRSFRVTMWT